MASCVECGSPLDVPARGRKPRYCSRACQARAYRARLHTRATPAPPARRPADPGLSRDRIVRSAILIADAHGLESLSMRHVATALGVKVMSLYTHLAGKDELTGLMVEAVFREQDPGAREHGGWRAALESAARWEWALYSRHSWVLEIIATVRPPLVPSLLAQFERGLGAFDGLGLDPVTVHRLYLGVSGLLQGLALLRVSEITAERRGTLGQWRTVQVPAALAELGPGRYPRQAALGGDPGVMADLSDLDEIFEFSLRLHLDGIARLLEAR
ncbi:TetR/AcrR family transcriptional regulator [Nonomuraea typhae]|uniref:TetR/AcrR family transcriptional regulator n=1 Tax=Nonomuraea typhae TaxID=2603600 RepID=UPI0012F8F146|nr:TetR/AcrR family transcriptional regulator [Nonomuraea typhae]